MLVHQSKFTMLWFNNTSAINISVYNSPLHTRMSENHYCHQGPISQGLFLMKNEKIGDKSANNQSEARISLAYNKNCHLSLMTSFVKWGPEMMGRLYNTCYNGSMVNILHHHHHHHRLESICPTLWGWTFHFFNGRLPSFPICGIHTADTRCFGILFDGFPPSFPGSPTRSSSGDREV